MGSERDRLLEPQTLGTVKLLVQALEARIHLGRVEELTLYRN